MGFYETALHLAIEKQNMKIIKILLSSEKIDYNIPNSINPINFMMLYLKLNGFDYLFMENTN